MKFALILLVLFFAAATATAQETYTQGASAANVADLSAVITADNEDTCESKGLQENCNQADICVATNTPGGSGCSAAQARTAGVRIYPLTFAGRDEFVLHNFVMPRFLAAKGRVALRHLIKCRRFWATATNTQKNTACAALGIPSTVSVPCEICQP